VFAFPGPTVARKGCFELREAAQRLGARVRPVGSQLEGAGLLGGRRARPRAGRRLVAGRVRALVHPALVEAAPRRLLEALAAGVPVIATEACGIAPQPGLTIVPPGDVEALAEAMRAA
jgi:hypothetical protein